LAATIVLAVLSLASVAGAEPPVREFVPASDFTVSGSCAFDVAVHIVGNKEYGITFSNGATLVTGSLKVTLTNVSDPTKSITLNIPGPGLNTVSGDGTFTSCVGILIAALAQLGQKLGTSRSAPSFYY
jgi:hypothetical protein